MAVDYKRTSRIVKLARNADRQRVQTAAGEGRGHGKGTEVVCRIPRQH